MFYSKWICLLLFIFISYGTDESMTYDVPYDTLEHIVHHYRTLDSNSLPSASLGAPTKIIDVIASMQQYLDQSMMKYTTLIADMDIKISCNGMSMQQCVVNRWYASTGTFDLNNSTDVCKKSGVLCDNAGNIITLAIDAVTHGLADQENRNAFKYLYSGLCKSPGTNRGSWYYVLQVFARRLSLSLASSTSSPIPSPSVFVGPSRFPSSSSASALPSPIQNAACKLSIGDQCPRPASTVAPCLSIDGFPDSGCSSPCFDDCRMTLFPAVTSVNNVFWGRSDVLFEGVTETAFKELDILMAYGCHTTLSPSDEDSVLFSTHYPMDESDVEHTTISSHPTPTSGSNSNGNPLVLGAPEWLKRWYYFSIDSDPKSLKTQLSSRWQLFLRTFRDYDRFTVVEQFLCSSSSRMGAPMIDALSSTFGLFLSRSPPSWSFPSDWPSLSLFWDENNNAITSNPLQLYICASRRRSKADIALLWQEIFFPNKPLSEANKKISKMFCDIWNKFINIVNSSLNNSHPKPNASPPSPSVFQQPNTVEATPGTSISSSPTPTETCKYGTSEKFQCSLASIKPCKVDGIVRERCCEGKSGQIYICQSTNPSSVPSLPTKFPFPPSQLPPFFCYNNSTETRIDCSAAASPITICTDADNFYYKCCIVNGVNYNCSGTRYPPLPTSTPKPSYAKPTDPVTPSTLPPFVCSNAETQTKVDCNATASPITTCIDADSYYYKCCIVKGINYNCSGTRYPPLPAMTPKPSYPQPTDPVTPSRIPTSSPIVCSNSETKTEVDCSNSTSPITTCTDADNYYYKCCIVNGVNYNCSGTRYPPFPSSSPANPSGQPPWSCANNTGDKLDCSILRIDLCYTKDGSLYKCCELPGSASSSGSRIYFCGDPIYKALPSDTPTSGFFPSITTVACKSLTGLTKQCSKDSIRNCFDNNATPYFCCYDGSISFRCEISGTASGSLGTGAPSLPSSYPTRSENSKDDSSTDKPFHPTIPTKLPFICYSNNGSSITGSMMDIQICQVDASTVLFPCFIDDFSTIYNCTSALLGQIPSPLPSSLPAPSSPPIVCVNNSLNTSMKCFPSDIYSCRNNNGNLSLCCKYQSIEYLCLSNPNPSSIPPTNAPAFIFVDTFLSPSISNLKTLKFLRISGFNMSGPVFSNINTMTSLSLLALHNNRLSSQLTVFKGMSITSLNMDGNWMYGTLDGLPNINGLSNVHLNDNLLFGSIGKNLELVFSKFINCEMNGNNFTCPNPLFASMCINNISSCVDPDKAVGAGIITNPISAPDVCITLSTSLKVTISTSGSSMASISQARATDDFVSTSASSFITINSTQRFSFVATIDSNISNSLKLPGSTSLPYALYSYSWTICAIEETGIKCPSDNILADKTIFPAGFTSSGFVIDYQQALHKSVFISPNSLTVSAKISLKNPCSTTDPSLLTSSSKLNVKIPSPPFGGKCKVTPTTGFAFTTVFTAVCSKFQSSNGTIKSIIFTYYSSPSSNALYVGILSNADSGSISFKSTAIGSMTLTVAIYDTIGSSTTVTVPNAFTTLAIQNGSNNNGTTMMSSDHKAIIASGLSDVITASKSNNSYSLLTNSLLTTSLLNSVGTERDQTYSSNIREQLATSMANVLTSSNKDLNKQTSEEASSTAMCGAQALESLTKEYKELTSNAILASSQALNILITMLKNTTVNPSIATSILNISSNIVNAATNSISDEQVNQAIQQNVTTISTFGKTLIKNAVPGEATIVTSSNVSLECTTGTVSSLSGNVSSKISLPNSFLTQSSIVGIADSNTVVSTVSLSWKTPIHLSSSLSISIAGETVSFFLLSNDKEIPLQNLTKKIKISMNLNTPKIGNEVCGFYDEKSNSYSTDGCNLSTDNGLSNSILICECDHATDYVPLLRVTGPSPSSSSSSSSSSFVNIGLKIGCVVGGIVLLSLLIIGVFLAIQRSSRGGDAVAPSTVTELPVLSRQSRDIVTPTTIPSRLKDGIPVDTQGKPIFLENGANTDYNPNAFQLGCDNMLVPPAYHRYDMDVEDGSADNSTRSRDFVVETVAIGSP